jgi:UTP--glucose-1-phosphate uridylyltransferase
MIAILPAAGKGTRMSEVSSGSKELLPVGSKAAIQWALDEAIASGVSTVMLIGSSSKPDLVAYTSAIQIELAIQEVPRGLAPAILIPEGLQPTLVILPDTIFFPNSPTKRLVEALNRGFDMAIAVERVPDEAVSRYGIVEFSSETLRMSRILEKPDTSETWSRWAIAARFALSARTMLFVRDRVDALIDQPEEIDLPPLLNEALQSGHTGIVVQLEKEEQRLDCGNPEGYRHACEVVNAGL